MNFSQLCSQSQFAFICNSPWIKPFTLNGPRGQTPIIYPPQPGIGGQNPIKSPSNQGVKFPQIPKDENKFEPLPSSGTIPVPPIDNSNNDSQVPPIDNEIPIPGLENHDQNLSPISESDSCNKDALNLLIGAKYDPKTKVFSKKDGTSLSQSKLPKNYRVIGPQSMATMDFIPQRVNIHYEAESKEEMASGIVKRVECG